MSIPCLMLLAACGSEPDSQPLPLTRSALSGCTVFSSDNAWNTSIKELPAHPRSQAFIANMGADDTLHPDFGTMWNDRPIGFGLSVVGRDQDKVPIDFVAYGDESDPGPYPIPPNAPVEGGSDADGDRHVLVIDEDTCLLYELYRAFPVNGGQSWKADSGAVFDLKLNDHHPKTFTSADAAGLSIVAGLVRYQEVVEKGEIPHALRFTVSESQAAYIDPAGHYASTNTDPDRPPMGLRLRMKSSYSCASFSDEVRVICRALKTYGMIVADNGSDWFISGVHDPRWNDDALGDLKQVPGSAFEVVFTGDTETY